ncbi:glycosyltransferases-like protein [Marinobacter lipolyticus SM19]|uniref:Glycosyltransferases-like protein n=1 Tax=Marinobacter lipolyticus SM19 TaxID=1318628 RepID=R8B5N1_9GAMM|nr:glycosyltransferase family 2 protein [Marinobacter lipolyticus]EON93902.1 glycosyltransferases-like protein [Marinobacter lipolyticus SM19]
MKLIISVVVYDWEPDVLLSCLRALSSSLDVADARGELASAELWLSHNGPVDLNEGECKPLIQGAFSWPYRLLPQQPNLGYGGTNNLVLRNHVFADKNLVPADTAILVLNPDVWPEPEAIAIALAHIRSNPRSGLVCSRILDPAGQKDTPGHKRYPSLAVLTARLLTPLMRLAAFRHLNERYEYRDTSLGRIVKGVEICSGCFLLARYDYWQTLNGFDEGYFMYFEDFDVALRGVKQGWTHVYDPSVRILHAGGGTGQKSWQHRRWFVRSAWTFFSRHGWRIWRV